MGALKARLSADGPLLRDTLRMLLRITGRRRDRDALWTFSGGMLHVDLPGMGAALQAEGTWRGRTVVPATALLALAAAELGPGPVEISVEDDHLAVGSFRTPCTWFDLAPARLDPITPPPDHRLVLMDLRGESAAAVGSGYGRQLERALRRRDRRVAQAAELLAPLGVTEDALRQWIHETILRRADE